MPIEQRWSSKNFTLDKIFNHDNIDIEKKINIENYCNLDSWESLRNYYKSDSLFGSIENIKNKIEPN